LYSYFRNVGDRRLKVGGRGQCFGLRKGVLFLHWRFSSNDLVVLRCNCLIQCCVTRSAVRIVAAALYRSDLGWEWVKWVLLLSGGKVIYKYVSKGMVA
jgi:hypothetical protein